TGGAGDDTLDGGVGADVMSGGSGNDNYYVDNAADRVIEAAGEGSDTIYASVSYTLALGAVIEVLRGNAGATGLALTGNELDNHVLGGDGQDVLNGGAGNDILDGSAGADTMTGGTGDDTFVVDSVGDVVTEAGGQGSDTVLASIDYALQTGTSIEHLK